MISRACRVLFSACWRVMTPGLRRRLHQHPCRNLNLMEPSLRLSGGWTCTGAAAAAVARRVGSGFMLTVVCGVSCKQLVH
jgi:hypothetical protein